MPDTTDRPSTASPGTVDIIVPVYKGLEETRQCVESVLQAQCATPFELVLIDDASPDPRLVEYCITLQGRHGVTVLVNAENLGFVSTVNRGMRLHPDRDVVLLNSDTEVANDWLDRLGRCAHSQTNVGTATPFSNNATICSYPNFCADNALSDIGLAELDKLFRRVNAGEYVDLPTAVGFCMYIKRTCLDQVGLFDTERFGRGYGEENDFSRRAANAGWRNVLCADTFVFHVGGVSFQTGRERLMADAAEVLRGLHPDYDALIGRFVAEDAPAKYRRAVDIALARRRMGLGLVPEDAASATPRTAQLHVVHDLGGGIARWVEDFCQADQAAVNLILAPYSSSPARGEGLVLHAGGKDMKPLAYWRFETPIQVTAEAHSEYRHVIEEIVRDFGVGAVLVSSLIGHALDALDTGLPTLVINHDFFPACPTINLHFDGVCQQCDDARLVECAAHNPNFHPFPNFSVPERLRVRAQFLALVARNTTVMVVPDDSVRLHLLQVFSRLHAASFVTIPHGSLDILAPNDHATVELGDRLRVVVLGVLPLHKGAQLLSDGLQQLLEFAEIHLVGAREYGEIFRDTPGVHVVDQYTMAELPAILAAIQPDVGLLPSIVPETFSYTLSELFQLGIPPVATRLGAFAKRILPGETGYLFEPNVEAMLECLRQIHGDRARLRHVRARLRKLPARTAADMVADYHRLLPGAANAGDLAQARPRIPQDALPEVAMTQALALSRQWREINSLRLDLYMKAERIRELNRRSAGLKVELLERGQTIRRLQQEAQRKADASAARDAQLEAVYASTSWAVSRPVRWAGNALRRARRLMPLLRRPAAWPSVAVSVSRAWRQEGAGGIKRALVQQSVDTVGSGAAAVPVPESHSHAEVAVAADWRQVVFRHYRASFTQDMLDAIRARIEAIPAPPLISVLMPTCNASEPMLREMIDSILRQWYPHWELCIADDGSAAPRVRAMLEEYRERDARVRPYFGTVTSGPSHAMNRALDMAAGDFVVLLNHDDMLEEQALFRVAEAVLDDAPDMLYSDEVLVAEDGATVLDFVLRPTFSPEYLRSHPYIGHLIGFRASLLRELGGVDEKLRISQDYDLILRASEKSETIVHIPEILYRWRIHGGSAGHEMIHRVMESSSAILRRHLQRCGEEGVVSEGQGFNFFDVRYPLTPDLKVAILIPTKNHADLVRACIESIERTVGDIDHEIVLIDHESDDPDSLSCFDSLRSRVTLLRYSGPFNFAAINNWAVAQLDGSHTHYLFCNNDIEAIEPGWLQRMLELGQKADVGIVGAKLYYPDGKTIQHAGVVVACCGVAENLGRYRLTSDAPVDLGYMGSLICNREVSAVTAACMLIRGTLFKEIGGFDEAIAVGYGDVDLCLRAGRRGYRTLFCAHAKLLHHESFTRGRSDVDPHPEDSARFLAKWRALFPTGDPYFNPNLSPHTPNWQVADPLEFKLDIRRRMFKRGAEASRPGGPAALQA
jgi:GT2 family glycosyltransferase/glycosyltransferase involved in cell wall biosynthesis